MQIIIIIIIDKKVTVNERRHRTKIAIQKKELKKAIRLFVSLSLLRLLDCIFLLYFFYFLLLILIPK